MIKTGKPPESHKASARDSETSTPDVEALAADLVRPAGAKPESKTPPPPSKKH